jgi:hypothetical protein
MNATTWMTTALLASVLALAGCGKPTPPPPPAQQGVTVDLPKLKEAFANASPDLQATVDQVIRGVADRGARYGQHREALAALDKLANTPGLTEPQKKIVSEVTEQIKQLPAKPPAQ